MTQNKIIETAELALKHSLFELVEPSLTIEHYGTIDAKIPHVFIIKFAELIIQECVKICEQNAEDVDNGDVFRTDLQRAQAYRDRWSTGSFECAQLIQGWLTQQQLMAHTT